MLLLSIAATCQAASADSTGVTTNNDDSCDIGVAPAATLPLPDFEVDFQSPSRQAVTTLVNVIDVSPKAQSANITLWTVGSAAWASVAFDAASLGNGCSPARPRREGPR